MKNVIVSLVLVFAAAGANASSLPLHYSAAMINATVNAISRAGVQSNLAMHKIASVHVESLSIVRAELESEGKTQTLRFRVSEERCGFSSCPLKAEQIAEPQ